MVVAILLYTPCLAILVIALILGAIAGGVIVTAVLATALGTRFARGLNW